MTMKVVKQTTKTLCCIGGLTILTTMMSACQSLVKPTNVKQLSVASENVANGNNANESARETLTKAVRSAMRSPFSFHSKVVISNELREQALINADETMLMQGDDFLTHCEHTHDVAYVALAKRALADGVDISSDRYIDERAKLKDDFLACKNTIEKQLSEQAKQSYGKYTQLDIKKSKLLQDYGLSATRLEMTGNYRPLKGQIVALPTAYYQSRNANLMVNQPIVVDIKSEKMYLWADNLALANATWLDKKLGLAWQNKWLVVAMNDGTLPQDFSKTLIKELSKVRLTNKNPSKISYLDKNSINEFVNKFGNNDKKTIALATQVIREQDSQDGLGAFYESMTTAYPVLLEKIDDPKDVVLDSKTLMQRVFAVIKKRLDKTPVVQTNSYYGLKNGKLVWHYHQGQFGLKEGTEPMQVGILTTLKGGVENALFDRLPVQHQTPTLDNQVDLLKYGNALMSELKKSDDVSTQLVARTLLAVLVGFDAPIGAEAEAEAESEVETQDETSRDNKTKATTGDGNQGEVNQDF